MTGRILQCTEGHVFCSSCYTRLLPPCPLCRSLLPSPSNPHRGPIRCLALEKLAASLINVACSFAPSGCGVQLRWNERPMHESTCIFRDLPCIASMMSSRFMDCKWTGPLNECVAHVTAAHRSNLNKPGMTATSTDHPISYHCAGYRIV